MKKSFDNLKYVELQKENILKRIEMFQNKLYLEMGGKLFDDLHASRILPGFESDIKTKLLISLKDKLEIIICINASDIEKNHIRADSGLSYENEALRLIDSFRALGLVVSNVVITLFKGQPSAEKFATKLTRRGEKVYFHTYTKGYPNDIETIVSDEGYGKNPYIETTRPLVVVTAPGPGSGKLATCLSQLYHEYKQGINAGYAKFETFPVWNLPLKHPVNIAYEAATADIKDINMLDFYHFNAYGETAVNYNRDLEVFPVVKNILKKITGKEVYNSPTDMGVNKIGFAIADDDAVQLASKKEVVRRFYSYLVSYKKGLTSKDTVDKVKMLMNELEINDSILPCIDYSRKIYDETKINCVAIELCDGTLIYGKQKEILSAPASMIINAVKHIAKIEDDIDLISDTVLKPILEFKHDQLKLKTARLTLSDVLTALSICSATNPIAKKCLTSLSELRGMDAHSTFILSSNDEKTLKQLGINITSEPNFINNNLLI